MAVAFDNVGTAQATAATTITSGAFVISGVNRAAAVHLEQYLTTSTTFTASAGGATCTLVAGSDSLATGGFRTLVFGGANPATGSQTGTVSWTGATDTSIGVLTCTGCDQTTPLADGRTNALSGTAISLTFVAAAGDLSTTCQMDELSAAATTNQTSKWNQGFWGSGDIETVANANPTHTWTQSSTAQVMSGAVFKQFGVAASTPGDAYTTGSPRTRVVFRRRV